MPITKTQLVGGSFQDSQGNLLANGYLTMRLSQDEEVVDSLICSGITIRIQLDSVGNVASSSSTPSAPNQFVWANDVMLPVNSYYKVTGFTASGQIAWGPNNQQASSGGIGGGTFDTGTWVPNQVISWTPPLQIPNVEVNGTPLSSQAVVNFEDSSTVTFSDQGFGAIKATASIPTPSRTSAIFYTIDGGGTAIGTGAKGQLNIPVNCTITGWVLTADQSGSAVVDVLRSTYGAFPTTASIAGSDKPTLSSVQKNENLGPLSGWGSTALLAGDQLQFNVNSATTVTRLNLTLVITIP